jgi:hypothetical protein
MIKLNLIPPYRKEEIKKACLFRIVLKWEGELILILALFIAGLFSINYILKINLSVASDSLSMAMQDNSQYKTIDKYDNEVKDMNKLLANASKIQSGQLYWSKFLVKFDEKVTSGIKIESLANKNYSISLVGLADTRDNLLVFKNGVEKDSCFQSINLPLSDLVSKDNVAFQMDFQFKKECLK